MGQVPFAGSGSGGAFTALCGLASVRVEQHSQPGDRTRIEFPLATHITDPSREIRHHDQFSSQPGKVGDVPQVHHAG